MRYILLLSTLLVFACSYYTQNTEIEAENSDKTPPTTELSQRLCTVVHT